MLKFIWNSWWRNKERFILLLVGMLIVSTGLSYLVGITQANNGTVVNELQKRWDASYDLIVRPPGSRSATEKLKLLEPNYMSGLDGGITMEQYEKIKKIENVEVAAPIAMIGALNMDAVPGEHKFDQPGIYRVKISEKTDTGLKDEGFSYIHYIAVGWEPSGDATNAGVSPQRIGEPFLLQYGSDTMIAGIDPEAEAQLVGVDEAIKKTGTSRYFSREDVAEINSEEIVSIPVIVSSKQYVDSKITYRFEKVDIPLKDDSMQETVVDIQKKGAEKYLDTLPAKEAKTYRFTTTQVHERLTGQILKGETLDTTQNRDFQWMPTKPSPVDFQPVASPFPERWPYSYQVKPYEVSKESLLRVRSMYRKANLFSEDSSKWPKLKTNYIGVFDPAKLSMSKDPLTELPMETYYPAKADWVMDANDRPVNPAVTVKPTNNMYDFLTKPPALLTTLDAAFKIRGEKAISAIRINVAGVDVLNEASEAKLQEVAQEIERETGLITDVTLGSSPQYALTYLPGLEKGKALGWVQQPWIKIGSSISIFKEAKVGMTGVVASVILVAIVYVFSSNIIMLYARKKEFAILLSLGWRPSQLSRLLFLEATILGTVVALISWAILGSFLLTAEGSTSLLRVILIGLSGLFIYWLGTLVPIRLVSRIQPYESMRSGEVTKGRRMVGATSILGMSVNQLATYWQRTLLSIVAIALPTSLFGFFLFVTFRLKGVLYASWIGEFVALEVGTMHYVAMGVALLIAILTTTEIMWQNVAERKAQLAVMKAMGWRNGMIRKLVLLEGAMTGLLAGVIGLAVAFLLIYQIYGKFPLAELWFLGLTVLIPVITGTLGALLPAERAVRITPNEAIGSSVVNTRATEKRFRVALGATATLLIASIIGLFLFAAPPAEQKVEQATVSEKADVVTTGTKLKDLKGEAKKQEQKVSKDKIDQIMEKGAIKTYFGDPLHADDEFKVAAVRAGHPKRLEARDGKQYWTVATKLQIPLKPGDEEGVGPYYRPFGFTLTTKDGKEYTPVDFVNKNKKAWSETHKYIPPHESIVELIYELPENEEVAVLYALGDAFAKSYTVKIELPDR
ncbi:FtsX-like permease family protein [Exiguobacterium flavidum]|uniref:FtsX-like permease family protein n=1 Tax=Exiguobacterium flavidum TaxID=2184695 RepID=UPI000DF8051E|nr:FtsX-like permease family protein [Exiguobacterium flavidum]